MAHKKKPHMKEKHKDGHSKMGMVTPMAHEKGKSTMKPMKHSCRGK